MIVILVFGARAYEPFGGASASDCFFQVGKAFNEKEGCNVRSVEIVERHGFVKVKTFECRLVEDERRSLRHTTLL